MGRTSCSACCVMEAGEQRETSQAHTKRRSHSDHSGRMGCRWMMADLERQPLRPGVARSAQLVESASFVGLFEGRKRQARQTHMMVGHKPMEHMDLVLDPFGVDFASR